MRPRNPHNARMDPRTALLIASLMSLLNGGVLGLMHRSLMREVRPSAVDWRIGTLLFAGGGILMAVQQATQDAVVLSLAYGMVFIGATLYWRSIRSFCELPNGLWMYSPAILGVFGIMVFSAVVPDHAIRGAIASAVLAMLLLAAGRTLQRSTRAGVLFSRLVIIVLLYGMGVLMVVRAVFFASMTILPDLGASLLWVDAATSIAIPVLPVIGTTAFLLMCAERARHALQHVADTDELTGLPNRRSITRAGEARFETARRGAHDFAVAAIDIDFFKSINDRYGHAFGDAALRHVAGVLDSGCVAPHLLGRQGGEEFVALMHIDDETSAIALAEALRRTVDAAPFAADGIALSISVSIGVSAIAGGDIDYDDVLRRADAALYVAKARGRNRIEVGRR
jgi:diguanylate cyclase (GGDEF)-like protein